MSTKLDFNENELNNAVWSGMKAIKAKPKKDSSDLNALSKGHATITKFFELRHKIMKYADQNPKTLAKSTLFLT